MLAAATYFRQNSFFVRLSQSEQSALLLDYDGTLAPFRPERDFAQPYPRVPDLLQDIARGHTRIVLISGRPALEIPRLLGLRTPPEIWGSHGMERLLPDGDYRVVKLDSRLNKAFATATASLDREGLGGRIELKPGSIAVHWRGLTRDEIAKIWTTALQSLQPIASSAGLKLLHFDGGVEMRVRTPNKGDAVRAILREHTGDSPTAYLGDDVPMRTPSQLSIHRIDSTGSERISPDDGAAVAAATDRTP